MNERNETDQERSDSKREYSHRTDPAYATNHTYGLVTWIKSGLNFSIILAPFISGKSKVRVM